MEIGIVALFLLFAFLSGDDKQADINIENSQDVTIQFDDSGPHFGSSPKGQQPEGEQP